MKQIFIIVLTILTGIPVCGDACQAANVKKNSSTDLSNVIRWNEIYYTTSDGNIVEVTYPDAFGAKIESNTYENGQGIITFDGNVSSIGAGAFAGSKLSSIKVSTYVTSIGVVAFLNCTDLKSIEIGISVNSIENSAFECCPNLTDITIDSQNSTYDSRDSCNAIIKTASNTLVRGCQTTIIPLSVTSIGSDAFSSCSNLTSVTIPNSVFSIGSDAFSSCSNLTSVTNLSPIPQKMYYYTKIFSRQDTLHVLPGCGNAYRAADVWKDFKVILEDATVQNTIILYTTEFDESVEIRHPEAFGAHVASNTYQNGQGRIVFDTIVTALGDCAFFYDAPFKTITLPDGLTSIGEEAFLSMYLSSITIPSSVTSIAKTAFSYCYSLTSITNLSTTPQSLDANPFAIQDTLHVLPGCGDAYRAADVWKDFKVILEDADFSTSLNAVHDSQSASPVYSIDGLPAGMQNKSGLYIQDRKKVLVR